MEAVALHALRANLSRQRHQFSDCGMTTVKARVEARDLRHVRQPGGYRVDGGEVVRLVQRRQRDQLAQLRQGLWGDDHRAGEVGSAMNDAMADANDRGLLVPNTEPRRKRIERTGRVAHALAEGFVDGLGAFTVLCGKMRRSTNAFDLSAVGELPVATTLRT